MLAYFINHVRVPMHKEQSRNDSAIGWGDHLAVNSYRHRT